jgi:hypothetical protein
VLFTFFAASFLLYPIRRRVSGLTFCGIFGGSFVIFTMVKIEESRV